MSPDREILDARASARQLLSADEVGDAIAAMAEQIAARLGDSNPVVLAVMSGGVFTAVRLCEHFQFPYEFDFIAASRYGRNLSGAELTWRVPPAPSLRGRTVLLVDDVLDRGVTLAEACRLVEAVGVAGLHVAVLVAKRLADAGRRPVPDFIGIHTDDVYLFGCGMDYKGYWRGLPTLHAVAGDD